MIEREIRGIRRSAGQLRRGVVRSQRDCAVRIAFERRAVEEGAICCIIRVFAPINDGVINLRGIPDGVKGHVICRGNSGKRRSAALSRAPSAERIPCARRGLFAQGQRCAGVHISGRHSRAAHGVKADPVAIHCYGDNVSIRRYDRVSRKDGIGSLDLPRGYARVLRLVIRRNGNLIAIRGGCFLRAVNGSAALRHKVNIENIRELCVHGDFRVFGIAGHGAEGQLLIAGIPALKALAFRHRRCGRFDNRAFADLDDLRIDGRVTILKCIGDINAVNRNNASHQTGYIDRAADFDDRSQSFQRRRTENHDDGQQHCQPFAQIVLHEDPPTPDIGTLLHCFR